MTKTNDELGKTVDEISNTNDELTEIFTAKMKS